MSELNNIHNKDFNYSQTPFFDYGETDSRISAAADRIERDNAAQLRRERTAKIFKVVIAVLLFTVFCQVVYHLYFARNVNIDKIYVDSGAGFSASDEQIVQMAGLSGTESYFSLDVTGIERRLERIPQIADAEVSKKFPDTLNIRIEGRLPLALCLVELSGAMVPAVVDSNGVIFQVGEGVQEYNLPVLSGIKVTEARIGARMPEPVVGFLESLNRLRGESQAFYNSISEFRFVRKTEEDFEVLMYPENYSIPVRVNSKINKKTFSYILLVLDVAEKQGMAADLQELDFRTDEVVYKVREE